MNEIQEVKKRMNRIWIAVIIVLMLTLVFCGAVYAYSNFWSGKAQITITSSTSSGVSLNEGTNVKVTKVEAKQGNWNDATKTWTVSIHRGDSAYLVVWLTNNGPPGNLCQVRCYCDSTYVMPGYRPPQNDEESNRWIAPGVRIQWIGDAFDLSSGESGYVEFCINTDSDASPGSLPEIGIGLRKY